MPAPFDEPSTIRSEAAPAGKAADGASAGAGGAGGAGGDIGAVSEQADSSSLAAPAAGMSAAGMSAAELEAAPFVPAEARAELLALKSGGAFLCARLDGDLLPGRASGEGFYAQDTRHLSELRLSIGGVAPVLLSSAMESGHHAQINATNPWFIDGAKQPVPQESLNIQRLMLIDERLHCQIGVRSFHRKRLKATVSLSLAADFADVFEVRSAQRSTAGRLLAPVCEADGSLRFAYAGEDGQLRETIVEFEPAPKSVEIDEPRALVTWEIDLEPGGAAQLEAGFQPRSPRPLSAPLKLPALLADGAAELATRTERSRQPLARAAAALEQRDERWRQACTSLNSDNSLFDSCLQASIRDLNALMMPAPGGQIPAAGIPWFVAPFGRDSLISSLACLMLNPDIARGTLLVLAGLQASCDEPWRDAEPGKILHELRVGELARLGHIPHTPYYGTVDATPLFVLLAARYWAWSADAETLSALRPALDGALEWIDRWGDRDGDGFIEYARRSPAGLLNQGWKDSEDALVGIDGTLAEGPIALVEAQGYVYAAKQEIAEVYAALGEPQIAARLHGEAAELRRRFNEQFWDEREQYFGLALDGAKRLVRSVTSNPAHCLYCGIVEPEKAALMAERLMADDMFSGWGLRTLSSSARAYNPMSYHNGSVWPHDNAIAAAGLKRYGFHDAAERIAGAVFDMAASERDRRLPELVCGFGRENSRQPVPYPVACSPQAWAAAAPFLLLQSLLGLHAHADAAMLIVEQPRLPDWLTSLELHGLMVGDSRLSLSFGRAGGGGTAFSLLEQHGELQVMMAA